MERQTNRRRVRLTVERRFVQSRIGPTQLATAYEQLVPTYRRQVTDPAKTANASMVSTLPPRSAQGA